MTALSEVVVSVNFTSLYGIIDMIMFHGLKMYSIYVFIDWLLLYNMLIVGEVLCVLSENDLLLKVYMQKLPLTPVKIQRFVLRPSFRLCLGFDVFFLSLMPLLFFSALLPHASLR